MKSISKMKKQKLILLALLVLTFAQLKAAINHPSLIVTKDMYPALRASGRNTSPILASTIAYSNAKWNQVPPTGANSDWWSFYYATPFSANALLYVINYDNETLKANYRKATVSLLQRIHEMYPIIANGDHENSVLSAGAFVNAVLAVDIMHDDFTQRELFVCDSIIDDLSKVFINRVFISGRFKGQVQNWGTAWKGANLVYYLYKDKKDSIPTAIDQYKEDILEFQLCSDGSWINTPGYWHARLAQDRVAKWCGIDILPFMGYYNFYTDPKMIKTMDWCNTFSLTPWGASPRLGETGSGGSAGALSSNGLMYRMSQWSEKAASNASWLLSTTNPDTRTSMLFTYLLTPITRATPIMPASALFKFSGATFWDKTNSTDALQGILYNPQREIPKTTRETIWHSSDDVNSVTISGYGEYLIMNAGTNYYPSYPGKAPDGGRWTEGWRQNIVLVDGKTTFLDKGGNGLTDVYGLKDVNNVKIGHGLVGGAVEFAEADIPFTATGNSNHWRTLFFVQPVAGQSNGYFLMRDKVQSNPAKVVTMLLHPNSQTGFVKNIQDKMEYQASINGFVTDYTNGTEKINVFYATAPDSVNIRQCWVGSFGANTNIGIVGKEHNLLGDYLRACYKTGTDGFVRFGTVLFPQDYLHTKATFSRISNTAYSGSQITHNANFIDYFIVPNASVENIYTTYTFNGESVFYRNNKGLLTNNVVANGKKFNDGATISTGFSADKNISIQMDDRIGSIISAGAKVTFSYNGILNVKLDNVLLTNVSSTSNSVTVDITAGKHSIELVSSVPNALSELKADNPISVRYNNSNLKEIIIQNKNASNQDFEFTLNDLQGRKILDKKLSFLTVDNAINVQGFSKGIYLWTLKTKDFGYSGKVLLN